jgi:hypothetical protein
MPQAPVDPIALFDRPPLAHSARMLARRTFLAGCAAALPLPARAAPSAADRLLARAIEAAGGETALARVRSLHWTGQARIHDGAQVVEIGVDTTVVPFRSARSETWLLSQGPASRRAMVLDGADLFLERSGVRSAAPAAQARHERQQFALYGLMLLVPLRGHLAGVTPQGELVTRHPEAPTTTLVFDAAARLVGAENVVDAPQGDGRIAQSIAFEERLESRGVRWPRKLSIRQDGRPYFDLALTRFDVG